MFIIFGIGKINVFSVLLYILILYFEIRFIINFGIVGGYKVNFYDIYLVFEVIYYDVDLMIFNYEYG